MAHICCTDFLCSQMFHRQFAITSLLMTISGLTLMVTLCSVGWWLQLWQVLPLVPPEDSFWSPYSGLDALCGNPLMIDLEDLVAAGLLGKSELPKKVCADWVVGICIWSRAAWSSPPIQEHRLYSTHSVVRQRELSVSHGL